jgi:hypothetical protein
MRCGKTYLHQYTMQGSSLSEVVFTEDDTDAGIEDVDVDCSGLERDEWLYTPVMLVNDTG